MFTFVLLSAHQQSSVNRDAVTVIYSVTVLWVPPSCHCSVNFGTAVISPKCLSFCKSLTSGWLYLPCCRLHKPPWRADHDLGFLGRRVSSVARCRGPAAAGGRGRRCRHPSGGDCPCRCVAMHLFFAFTKQLIAQMAAQVLQNMCSQQRHPNLELNESHFWSLAEIWRTWSLLDKTGTVEPAMLLRLVADGDRSSQNVMIFFNPRQWSSIYWDL